MAKDIHLDLVDIVDRARVAAPCPVRWEDLDGEGSTRHCRQCDLDVHNFSEMTRDEVETILRAKSGRLCAGWYRRADGTMMTADCPVGLRALRRKTRRMLARVAAALGLLVTGGIALGRGDGDAGDSASLRRRQPFALLGSWIAPARPAPPPRAWIAGDICVPPPPTPPTAATPTAATDARTGDRS